MNEMNYITELARESAELRKERIRADQERRRSNAAGTHKTDKHPDRSARRTEIAKEQENG